MTRNQPRRRGLQAAASDWPATHANEFPYTSTWMPTGNVLVTIRNDFGSHSSSHIVKVKEVSTIKHTLELCLTAVITQDLTRCLVTSTVSTANTAVLGFSLEVTLRKDPYTSRLMPIIRHMFEKTATSASHLRG